MKADVTEAISVGRGGREERWEGDETTRRGTGRRCGRGLEGDGDESGTRGGGRGGREGEGDADERGTGQSVYFYLQLHKKLNFLNFKIFRWGLFIYCTS